MDQYKSPCKSSGIPRLVSRIPLPTYNPSKSIRPSPSRERLQADPGIDFARLRRPSEEIVFKKPLLRPSSPIKDLENSSAQRDLYHSQGVHDDRLERMDNGGKENQEPEANADNHNVETPVSSDIRPSLLDRTIETLSRIPPSPSPRGRKSAFFNSEAPMRSPSRPPSSMNSYSRSPSRSSFRQPSFGESTHLSSSMSMASSQTSRRVLTANLASISQRPPSLSTDLSSKPTRRNVRQSLGTEKMAPSRRAETLPARNSTYGPSKSPSARPSKPRPSLSQAFAEPTATERCLSDRPLVIKKTRKPSSTPSPNLTSPSSTISKVSSVTSAASSDANTQEPPCKSEVRKVSKSSNALRESIAKAKAARKAARQSSTQADFHDPWEGIEIKDPFSQIPKESNHGLLRKRAESARTSGHLNIASMGLNAIPNEILTMYDFDPSGNSDWYESVDLVKFIAADNELEELSENVFPDIDPDDFDLNDDSKGNQFGGLEVLDLHGNGLNRLPLGLRRLTRLQSLNLSNNKLTMDRIEVIAQIEKLTDLRLGNNDLEGELLSVITQLSNLEILDLRANRLTRLPDSLESIKSLKILNIGENELTSLPFEALSILPLTELSAPKNKLRGCLIPESVHQFDTLQTLNVANNALERLSENDAFTFPNLQILAIDANHLKSLPHISSWKALLRLSAEDNNIAALPGGLVELEKLKHVDFTGNDISRLDERIGLMNNLVTFRISNNPIRERKFLSMDTEELKQDLRNRCVAENQEAEEEEEGSVATEFTLAPESPTNLNTWKVKPGGILDRSSTDMVDMNVDELGPLISSQYIKCLYIHHNKFRSFPVAALGLLAHNLTDLDLSNNPLDSMELVPSHLSLPNLCNLNLSATGLVNIEHLQTNLAAPLKFLDVSNNRLNGPLPVMRATFPNLITLLAADNQISSLEFESVQGLQVLDISNNSIDFLPPRIGLLGDDGSGSKGTGKPGLRRFEVAGNSFRVPKWQVVAKGTEAVLEWLKGRIPAEEFIKWEAGNDATASAADVE
ncbi:hypothetical protein V8E54_000217 [Elaphomyces granulatus]